jgi:hypothetical protein
MNRFNVDLDTDEPAIEYLERRWFATLEAVASQEAQCKALQEVLKISEAAWRHAQLRLVALKGLRDGLEEQIDALHGFRPAPALEQDRPQKSRGGYKRGAPQALRLSGQAM